ncbi:MBL fold metallo-hydrolase [Pseudonocardia kunmingensis]|uniref:MBL fold metallo-hydrolase n=1 Tax=Pseudonocardia kunmingensis TaxID=630975 RepID=UPI001FE50644|nr:MBL fold metallo-hydrolase [Pseudonocardia kunmingensis]
MPIPDNPLRYTLSYLLPCDDGLLVVDPGWDSDDGWTALVAGLTATGAGPGDVVGVVATHVHPDHHGLSARLRAESGAWIAMHPAERDTLPQRTEQARSDRLRATSAWLRRSGAPKLDIAQLIAPLAPGGAAADRAAMAEPDVLLADGDRVPVRGRAVRAVWTPGHTPGHLCLVDADAGVLLTGDHVLPRITPNVGLSPAAPQAPLARFLESLDRVAAYDQHLALPAHEYRFRGLAARTRALRLHHEDRCRELLELVVELDRPTLWQVAANLTWSRPWQGIGPMRIAALAETAAHVQHLVDQSQLAWLPDDGAAPRLGLPATTSVA